MLAPPSRLLAGDLTAVLLRLGDISNETAGSSIDCRRPFLQPAPLLMHPLLLYFFFVSPETAHAAAVSFTGDSS